jgi:hypothetical protein
MSSPKEIEQNYCGKKAKHYGVCHSPALPFEASVSRQSPTLDSRSCFRGTLRRGSLPQPNVDPTGKHAKPLFFQKVAPDSV